MSWLWFGSASKATRQNESLQEGNGIQQPSSSSSSSPSSRNEADKSILEDFMSHISDEVKSEEVKAPNLTSSHMTTHLNISSKNNRQTLDSISEQLLPTTMSCRDAFDSAYYCASLGGAFTNLYRYGTVRSCSDHWDKFWFCMRTRTYDDKSKQEAIKDYYRKVELSKYGKRGTSSQDIWKSRDHLVQKGTAFKSDEEEWKGTDEELRTAILDMRKRIIEAAGSSGK
ncbi:hypothetical protein GcM3_195037 [Golovinomyces cichoracearum]|uniref:Early meiotic induction protein 1 n=1 Tax=Golovinomyces cichoracearum TaxID=62708 RepID=A0A420HG44_9PEZI|nr:hypothetical protein GcM3_195037 [Golovinomyces cichoracearum]